METNDTLLHRRAVETRSALLVGPALSGWRQRRRLVLREQAHCPRWLRSSSQRALRMTEQTPIWGASIDLLKWFQEKPERLDFVLANLLSGAIGALVSPGDAGKSTLALQLAAQIAGGKDLLEIGAVPPGPVICLSAADPPPATHHRIQALGQHLSPAEREAVAGPLEIQPLIGRNPNAMDEASFELLMQAAVDRRLLILDPMKQFRPEEENASRPMTAVLGRLERIANATGCATVSCTMRASRQRWLAPATRSNPAVNPRFSSITPAREASWSE